MANNLSLKDRFANFLFGTPVQGAQFTPRPSYGEEAQKYLDTIPKQAFVLNQPKETGLTPEQYQAGFMQGLNYGNPEWAKKQDELGIRKPTTGEEIDKATIGEFNSYPTSLGISNAPRQGGLINDFMGGLRENYNEGLQAENLMPNQNKGWATRLGEGFGTALRFADKPIGRFALATGLSALTDEANPLAEGVTAYVGRQQNQTADRLYRQQLKQLGYTDEDLGSIRGNITKDMYEGITSGMRLGNQRITYGQLAQFDDEVAEMINKNPMLSNQFVPITLARDVYGKKREKTEADIEGTKAKTEKTKAETGQVGKPRVNISIRKGGTTSVIRHEGGSGGTPAKTGGGQSDMVRVKAPDGRTGTIPRANLRKAINAGYEVI